MGICFSHHFNTQQQVFGLREKLLNNFDFSNYLLWILITHTKCIKNILSYRTSNADEVLVDGVYQWSAIRICFYKLK
jgi:hypothetical protein